MASNLIGNEAPLSGVAGSSPVSSAFSKRDSLSYDDRLRKESVFCFLVFLSVFTDFRHESISRLLITRLVRFIIVSVVVAGDYTRRYPCACFVVVVICGLFEL